MSTESGPERIQLRRTKGWRIPEGAVIVDRRTQWGNPWTLADARATAGPMTDNAARAWCVRAYRRATTTLGLLSDAQDHLDKTAEQLGYRDGDTWAEHVRRHLAGLDLACWCPLHAPCHADVLLELANPPHPS